MDSFFAAIEVMDNQSLKGKPVIVGGPAERGVVFTASYEARKYGVGSAMPMYQARKKCPQGIFLPVRMERYKGISGRIMDMLCEFTPLVEQVSIDEAYLDITGTRNLLGEPEEAARKIKTRVFGETGLTCSVGIAPNKILAKMASDMNKPDGLTAIHDNEVEVFLSAMPVQKIPGVGKNAFQRLRKSGVRTAGDLQILGREKLSREFGKFGFRLYEISKGIDDSPVSSIRGAKSISSEGTLKNDSGDPVVLRKHIRKHIKNVARRLRKDGLLARTVTLKIRLDDFSTITRSRTLYQSTNITEFLEKPVWELLQDYKLKGKVRLVGVSVSNIRDDKKGLQLGLFEQGTEQGARGKVDKALDEIRERFGEETIKRGDL